MTKNRSDGAPEGIEESLRESEAKYRYLAEKMRDIVWTMNLDLRTTYVSPSVTAVLGFTPEERLAQTVDEQLTPASLSVIMDTLARELALESQGSADPERSLTLECEYYHKDGSVRWLENVISPLRDGRGVLTGLHGVSRDVTERKRAEAAVREALREKEVLLKEVHHRVKNNMQVISSLFSLQADNVRDAEARRILKEGQSRVRSMALIHEKLYQAGNLSKIDFGGYLKSLVVHLVQAMAVDGSLVNLEEDLGEVFLDINAAVPCGLLANELIANALEHAFPGGRKGVIRLGLRRLDGGDVELRIADNGAGFPEGLDFRRTESLGLQIVNLLVGQLAGTIELDGRNGTAFTIRIPETRPAPARNPAAGA